MKLRFAPRAVLACVLVTALAGCPVPGGAANPGVCPPQTRDIAKSSAFDVTLIDEEGQPRDGVAVKVVRTPRAANAACPGKLRDEASATTDAAGRAAFWNLERGTYVVEAKGLKDVTIDFGAKVAATTFMINAFGRVTPSTPKPANLVTSRFTDQIQLGKVGLPPAGAASVTVADAAAARAFVAWLEQPDPALTSLDFAKERFVALYNTLPVPGCNAAVVFERTAEGVAFRVDTFELPKGLACAAPAMPRLPFWGVAILPADPKPVVGTTALAADAAWLTASPAPSPAASASASASPGAAVSPGGTTSPAAAASPGASAFPAASTSPAASTAP